MCAARTGNKQEVKSHLTHYCSACMERLRKSMNSLSEHGLSPHLNLNLGPHKYGVQTTQSQHSLNYMAQNNAHFTHTPHTV